MTFRLLNKISQNGVIVREFLSSLNYSAATSNNSSLNFSSMKLFSNYYFITHLYQFFCV